MIKLKSYKEYLKMGKEKVNESLAPVRAARARKQAELEVAKLDEQIANHEAKLTELCSVENIDFFAIIKGLDDLGLAERKKSQFEKLLAELFPEK